jgi:hypothetical protein
VGVVPAGAAPVESSRLAEVSFDIPLSPGATTHVYLFATRSSSGDRLEANLLTCRPRCGADAWFGGALPTGALELDAQQASGRLRLSLGGVPLQVTWQPQVGVGVARGHVDGGGGTTHASGRSYRGDPALATVALRGSCQGPATVGSQVDVDLSGGRPTQMRPLSQLRLPVGGAPRCTG